MCELHHSPEGNRILSKQGFEKVVLPPAGVEAFALDTRFEAGALLEQVVGNLAKGRQGFWE